MKRRLVFEDQELLSEILRDLRFFKPSLEKLKTAYESLEIGQFTDEILDELVLEGTGKIFERHTKSLNDQLDKTGVVNTKLREFVLQGTDGPKAALREALTELRSIKPEPPTSITASARTKVLPLELISFDGERFFISDSDKDWLTEAYCRDYLESEATQDLYARLEIMRDALNDFRRILSTLDLRYDSRFVTSGLDKFLCVKDDNVSIIPKSVNGNIKGAAALKAYHQARAEKDAIKAAQDRQAWAETNARFDELEKKGKVIS